MLLTITYTGQNARDLGYLLYKHPDRTQQFTLSFGKVYVFYPEASDDRTTAALLLDIDPIDLVRGKAGSMEGGLFDYVNDRPYVSSSFLSTAIARVFGSAIHGVCDKKPELVQQRLALSARIHMLPCRGGETLARELFEPLGYQVMTKSYLLDEQFPQWGMSSYLDLEITGQVTLSRLLNHLYVLIPVFDRQKHYFVGEDEISKLLAHGKGWLETHPAREKITSRYFSMHKSYARQAMSLLEEQPSVDAEESEPEQTPCVSLNTKRLEAVRKAVLESGAATVLDLGCGECKLTKLLLEESQIRRITAADVSIQALERGKSRLRLERMPQAKREKLTLLHGSVVYRDPRFSGFDAACVVELLEHLDPFRIPAFEQVLFAHAAPGTVILTTPNREYNVKYPALKTGALRHGDHRFEWTRQEFADWAAHVCRSYGYQVVCSGIGEEDPQVGAPTQMGVFTKCV